MDGWWDGWTGQTEFSYFFISLDQNRFYFIFASSLVTLKHLRHWTKTDTFFSFGRMAEMCSKCLTAQVNTSWM